MGGEQLALFRACVHDVLQTLAAPISRKDLTSSLSSFPISF